MDTIQLGMKQKNKHFSELVAFLALLFPILFRGGKEGQERIYLHYRLLLGVSAERPRDRPPADAHKPPASQHLLLLPLESSETQRTAGLSIYYGHKWNLQSQ